MIEEEPTHILNLCENIYASYESDYAVPSEVLEEMIHYCEVELRERDEEQNNV